MNVESRIKTMDADRLNTDKKNILASLLFVLFELTLFFYIIMFKELKVFVAGIGAVCFVYAFKNNNRNEIAVPLFAIYIFAFMSAIYTGNYANDNYLMPIVYYGASLMILYYKLNYTIFKIAFIIVAFFFLVYYFNLIPIRMLNSGYSANYVGVEIFNFAFIFYITAWRNNKRIALWPAIVTAVICLVSTGRSAIILGGVLMFLIIIYNIWQDNKLKAIGGRIKNILLVLIIFIAVIFFYKDIYDALINPYLIKFRFKLDPGLQSTGRSNLLNEYFYQLQQSAWSVLYGVPSKSNYLFVLFGNNWHNSYLRLHAYFGIGGVLSLLVLMLKSCLRYIKHNKLYFIILLIVCFRCTTDSVAFNGFLDPIIYYLLLNSYMGQDRRTI